MTDEPLTCTCPYPILDAATCPFHSAALPIDLPDEFDPAPDPLGPAKVMAWLVGALIAGVALICGVAFVSYMAGAASVAP